MESSRKCCIGFMPAYTYGNYVYFNNLTDTPNEHNNNFILNHVPDFHITSPFKLTYDKFESLPNLSVDKMQKHDEIKCLKCCPVIKSQCMEQIKTKTGTNL